MTTADNTSDSVWGSVSGNGYAYIMVHVTDANGWKGSAYMWVYMPASSGSGSGCL